MKPRITLVCFALILVIAFLAACGGGAEEADTSAADAQPVPDRPQPTDQEPQDQVEIAMIAIQNNPFFAQVREGFDKAETVLEARGASIEWLTPGTQVTVDTVGQAMDTAAAQGYDGIASLMPGEGICAYIERTVDQGIAVAAYNGDATCAKEAGTLFFHGQDLYAAGQKAAELMCEATEDLASEDNPGKVGITTESFTFQALEERRNGFIDGLKETCPWVTPVNQGVEDEADPQRIASNTRDFMSSTPNLVGIYVTGGNPYAAAQVVNAAGKTDEVKVIAFDFTEQNVEAVRNGSMYALIGQDPFGQAYDTLIWLYNYVVTDEKPTPKYFMPTDLQVMTKDNIDKVLEQQ
jgi:ribose transport system substrate-binding protein